MNKSSNNLADLQFSSGGSAGVMAGNNLLAGLGLNLDGLGGIGGLNAGVVGGYGGLGGIGGLGDISAINYNNYGLGGYT